MRFVGAAIVLLVPLSLAPGWFFYYDITPKACLLYLGAALLAAFAWTSADLLCAAWSSGSARWYLRLTVASLAITVLAAMTSPEPQLAWLGSNWRRGGAITEVAILIAAPLIALAGRAISFPSVCAGGIVASLYGIAQYFGWDPWISQAAYVVGEGAYQIVRPPSTLGHSDYFAAFLLWPVFAGAGLWCGNSETYRLPYGRGSLTATLMTSRDREGAVLATLGATATVTGLIAILLAGSRGAWLGVLMGAAVLFALRPVPVRILAVSTLATATLFGIFYLSPAGDRLRARAFWISEDRTGGARLLLWQDSLHMAASRPVLGYGPDVFPAVFPQFQSRELARAYPDFAHESPHNVLLDLLTAEGLPGLILLLAMAGVGVAAGWKQRSDPMSGALLAGLVGCLVTQQFIVFVTPTALLFYTAIGLLTFDKPVPHPSSKTLRIGLMLAGVPMAAVFLWAAHGVGSGDRALFWARTAFEAAKTGESAEAWQAVQSHRSTGVSADIELSRSAMAATARAGPFPEKMVFAQLAAEAAQAATLSPEFRVNAWYNLAVFQATSNSAAAVEASLRAAITTAPRWFKPHWMLARVLAAANRRAEARQEAEVALDLDNKKHTEVTETLETIFRSPGSIK